MMVYEQVFLLTVLFVTVGSDLVDTCQGNAALDASVTSSAMLCAKMGHGEARRNLRRSKPRRYDIANLGHPEFFHGWADVQGQGAANDYCRFVAISGSTMRLSCALAGTHGEGDMNYNAADGMEAGYEGTWYMRDEDRDGRDDYCRCVGSHRSSSVIVCTKAGPCGFYGSREQSGQTLTFNRTTSLRCETMDGLYKLRPEFGMPWTMPNA